MATPTINKIDLRFQSKVLGGIALGSAAAAIAMRWNVQPGLATFYGPNGSNTTDILLTMTSAGAWMASMSTYAQSKGKSAWFGLSGVLMASPIIGWIPLAVLVAAKDDYQENDFEPTSFVQVTFSSDMIERDTSGWELDHRSNVEMKRVEANSAPATKKPQIAKPTTYSW